MGKFSTSSIALATFLRSQGLRYERVDAIEGSVTASCRFVFDKKPDAELLEKWLSGDAQSGVSSTISAFRHLLREARIAQRRLEKRETLLRTMQTRD